jgi:hypothetical protein
VSPSNLGVRAYQTNTGFQERFPSHDADFTKRIGVLVVRHIARKDLATPLGGA